MDEPALPFVQYATPHFDEDIQINDAIMIRYGNSRIERVTAVSPTMVGIYNPNYPGDMERYHRHLVEKCGFFVERKRLWGLLSSAWDFIPTLPDKEVSD